MKSNKLSIEWRIEDSGNTRLRFADFMNQLIPSPGSGTKEYQEEMIRCFLMQKPHAFLWYRVPIMVCSHCGDLECGYISAKIERTHGTIVWKDFYRDDYRIKMNIMPLSFNYESYKEAIESTLVHAPFIYG